MAVKLSKGVVKTQVNVLMPLKWQEKLNEIARKESTKQKKNINYQDLIRATLQKEFKLPEMKEK